MGDPAGVGPEVCLHLLHDEEIARLCTPVVFGNAAVLDQAAVQCRLIKPDKVVAGLGEADAPSVFDIGAIDLIDFETGTVNAATGRAGYTYVENAIDAALGGQVAAVTTAPLNKEALHAAGISFPGHTEIFASRTHAQRSCMLQFSSEVRCVFVTCLLYTSPSPRDLSTSRMPSSA